MFYGRLNKYADRADLWITNDHDAITRAVSNSMNAIVLPFSEVRPLWEALHVHDLTSDL